MLGLLAEISSRVGQGWVNMPRDYNTTVDLLQSRIRQAGNIAVTQNFATEVLSRCEQIINAYLGSVKATTSFSTGAKTLVYDYRSTLTAAVDIIEITESDRALIKLNRIEDLSAYDIDWFRKVDGTEFTFWLQIARDTLIIYPGKASAGSSDLEITYTKLTTGYATYAAAGSKNFELPDEDVELALALAEIILLARGRALSTIPLRLKQFVRTLGVNWESLVK